MGDATPLDSATPNERSPRPTSASAATEATTTSLTPGRASSRPPPLPPPRSEGYRGCQEKQARDAFRDNGGDSEFRRL
jgi:hypothetical protein